MAAFLVLFSLIFVKMLGAKHEERIVGGNVAPEGAYPFIGSLRYFDVHWCGASIIHKRWVLTAAHCVKGRKPNDYEISVGTNLLDGKKELYPIKRIIYHQEYSYPEEQFNDIAVLRLKEDIKFNKRVKPIKLDVSEIKENTHCILPGWGAETYPNNELPSKLRHIKLNTTSITYCQDNYLYPVSTTGDLCTFIRWGEGSCLGDSGGPLIRKVGKVFKQIGIVSRGMPCANGYPDIFARVSAYISWIRKNCRECIL